jgi:hypothetical protein
MPAGGPKSLLLTPKELKDPEEALLQAEGFRIWDIVIYINTEGKTSLHPSLGR